MSARLVRARPLMGTLVTIQLDANDMLRDVSSMMAQTFAVMTRIASVMSAHDAHSDLGRMSRARSGEVMQLDVHTWHVLQAAKHWAAKSHGAFNPALAGKVLAHKGTRPGLLGHEALSTHLADVALLDDHCVRMAAPVALDVGGIAKGYALDQAAAVLQQRGCQRAILNAGGDLRVVGERRWPVEVRHAGTKLRDRKGCDVRFMREGALATSVIDARETQFVRTVAGRGWTWRSATVWARDGMTADILTKWALQSSPLCPQLHTALRAQGARMWRT